MEIEGKVIAVLAEQGGVSSRTGNAWKSQEYVIETHDQYPRKCCFRVFGADRIAAMNIQVGEELRVSLHRQQDLHNRHSLHSKYSNLHSRPLRSHLHSRRRGRVLLTTCPFNTTL